MRLAICFAGNGKALGRRGGILYSWRLLAATIVPDGKEVGRSADLLFTEHADGEGRGATMNPRIAIEGLQ